MEHEQSTAPSAPGAPAGPVRFSVVVPVYNSESSLEELASRLDATFTAMGAGYEVIFVDDGSRDGSLTVLRRLKDLYPGRVRVVSLYRNQGQHIALMCGFRFCTGDVVVTIDDDLQHDPEDIPAMYAVLEQGYDAVFGAYRQKAHGLLQNLGSAFVRRLVHRIFDPPRDLRLSAFRLIRSEVVDHFKEARTSFPYVSGLILSTTHRVTNVEVAHHPRRYGRSGYTLPKLIRLSFNLLINYSAIPLKAMAWLGMAASLLAFVAGAVFVTRQLLLGRAPEGWTSLAVLISAFAGILFAMMFVMAEYLSRLLSEAADRPAPPIREIIG
jgi:glycosyltransferase involved in cell wall biosynthesis